MAEPQPAAQVAKELGIYLGQIYPLVEKGLVKNHKPDGKYNIEGGKGLIVDIDEVRSAMSSSRKRGGKGSRGPKAGSKAHAKVDPAGAATARRVRKEDFPVGTMIVSTPYIPRIQYHVVTGRYRSLVYMDRKPDSLMETLFWKDTARDLLAKGVAQIARPEGTLGMIMFHWISQGQVELATALEEWCEKNGLEVTIPDPVIIDIDPSDLDAASDEETEEDDEE